MSDITGMPLAAAVNVAAYESLQKVQPAMLTVIRDLLAAGLTPDQIEAGAIERGATPLIANLCGCAADYIKGIQNAEKTCAESSKIAR